MGDPLGYHGLVDCHGLAVHFPIPLQNAVEMVFEFVEDMIKGAFKGHNPIIAPLALTLFVWILFMNTLKIIPVDYFPVLFSKLGVDYMKIVPTTDVNATLGLALGVFGLILYYSFKVTGSKLSTQFLTKSTYFNFIIWTKKY